MRGQLPFPLFGNAPERPLPAGFAYRPALLTDREEADLVAQIRDLPLKEFEFHGFTGKRRVISYGWCYDFTKSAVRPTDDMPAFLLPLREATAQFAGLAPGDLHQALVTEYAAGAGIGWHRDKAVFGEVLGVSLVAPCTFRLRRRAGAEWERVSLELEPRSVYILRGPVRTEWEHSIPPVAALRYSITFRRLLEPPSPAP